MKRIILILFTFLTIISFNLSRTTAQNFNLSVNKIFTEGEEITANSYNYYYNWRNKGKNQNQNIQLALYEYPSNEIFSQTGFWTGNFQIKETELQKLNLIKCWETSFNNRYNTQINVGKLSEGIYLLEGFKDGKSAIIPIIVSNYNITTQTLNNEMLAYVTDKNGNAVGNFTAYTQYGNTKIKAKNYKKGIAYFNLKELEKNNANGSLTPIYIEKNGKFAVSSSYYNRPYQQQQNTKKYIFTDRSAYRPNQTIKFKGIFREKNGNDFDILTGDIEYKIYNPQNKEVAKKTITLDKNGSFSDEIIAESDFMLGEYRIVAHPTSIPENRRYWWGERYQCTFKIEEYKKPEFEVKVNLDKAQYISGETIKTTIAADYFFGAPVTKATLSYRVVRQEYYTPWYYRYRCWWWYEDYYTYYQNQEIIENGSGELNEEGKFEIEYKTDLKTEKNYRYTIIAEVQDESRRTISGSSSVIVANTEFTLAAQSEQYYYEPNETASIIVSAKDYSQNPISTNITAKLYNRNNYWRNQKEQNLIETTTATTNPATGETILNFKVKKSGYYYVEIEAKDSRGKKTTASTNFYILKEDDYRYKWWQQNGAQVQIITDKKVYNAGETINSMIYVPNNVDAMVTVYSQAFDHYETYNFSSQNNDGEGAMRRVSFKIDEKSYGKMEIKVVYIKNNTLHQKQEQFTIIPQQQYLNVAIEFDENEYRPAKIATATVKITDHLGNPVPNADVTLATADEALFSLYPDKTPDIRKVFYESNYIGSPIYHNRFSLSAQGRFIDLNAYSWREDVWGQNFDIKNFVNKEDGYRLYNIPQKTKGKIQLAGIILDEKGNRLQNVKVSVNNQTFITNEDGVYAIQGFPESNVDLELEYEGKKMMVKNVAIYNNGQDYVLNLIFSKKEISLPENYLDDLIGIDIEENMVLEDVAVAGNAVPTMAMEVRGGRAKKMDKSANFDSLEMKDEATNLVEPTIRSNFQDAIYWNPNVTTDSKGEATVKIQLPDNLTTWRTSAKVITPDTKIGQTEAKIIVTKNLLVRMETPRFMRVGDELLIATNIHNYLDSDKNVEVSLAVDGLEMEGTTQNIDISANGEQRIDWKVAAKWIKENAELTVKALTNEESDAMVLKVPVLPFGLEMIEAQATHLQDKETEILRFNIGESIDMNSVQLQVNASPSVTSALLSSMEQLVGYPYGCVEQTMSRFVPLVAVGNTLNTLGENYQSSLDPKELQKMVDAGFKRLGELQHSDGGYGWWAQDGSHPFMTAYVAYGMFLAKNANFKINETVYNKTLTAFKNQVKNQKSDDKTTYAYQMMVAMHCGFTELWDSYYAQTAEDNPYQLALLLQAAVLADDTESANIILQKLEKKVNDEGRFAFWGGKKFYYRWQDDQVETTAHVVKGISMLDNNHPLLPKATQWLMSKRKGNSWHNTRQTAMTILGLQEIIKKETNPNFEYEIWVNGQLVDEKTVTNANVFEESPTISLRSTHYFASLNDVATGTKYHVLSDGENEIEIRQKGKGSNYINTKLIYFADQQTAESNQENQAFSVKRDYYKLEKVKKGDKWVYEKQKIDLNSLKSGDDVLVKVKVNSKEARDFVLIEDPIPAGCEFIRDNSGYVIEGENQYQGRGYAKRWWWGNWYTHREMRDTHLAFTITRLPKGDYEYTYLMKAQIPGTYKVAPTIAQLMYYTEVRGWSDFGEVKIEE